MRLKHALRRARIRTKPRGGEILALHASAPGQLSIEESYFLFRNAAGHATIVEIGSYRGKSCVMLAKGALADPPATGVQPHVTAIDPHQTADDNGATNYNDEDERVFYDTIKRHNVDHVVTHLVKMSHDARPDWPDDKHIDFLWIDGDHSYEGCKTDLEDWAPLVRPGGSLACHDYTHRDGVKRAFDEFIDRHPEWTPGPRVRSIASATRAG